MIFVFNQKPGRKPLHMKIAGPAITSIFVSILFSSCTKSELTPKADVKLLLNKRWEVTGKTTKNQNGSTTDEFSLMPASEKDDYYYFKADSTYEYNDNMETKTGVVSKILDAGTWRLINGDTYLELHSSIYNTTTNPSKIKELTENKLFLETEYPGDHTVVWVTYKPF